MAGQENSMEALSATGAKMKDRLEAFQDIPPELRPKKTDADPVDVSVAPQPMDLTPEEIQEIEQQFGVIRLGERSLKELKNLGVHLNNLGIDRLTQANMFINQQAILTVLTTIAKDALEEKDADKRRQYAQPLGYLSGQLSRAGLATKEVGEKTAPPKLRNGARFRSFRPGEELQPPLAVQIINNMPGAAKG